MGCQRRLLFTALIVFTLCASRVCATHGIVRVSPTIFSCGLAPVNGSLLVGGVCRACATTTNDTTASANSRACTVECLHGNCEDYGAVFVGSCATQHVCVYDMCGSTCAHKGLSPVSGVDIAFIFTNFFGSVASILGGIGGGGFFVPLLMAMTGFDVHEAVPLSKAMIFAGAIVTLLFEVRRKHPDGRRIVDYNACLILQPLCLAGTVYGVYLNVLLPQYVIVIALTVVLALSTYKTLEKAIQQHRKGVEDERKAAALKEGCTKPLCAGNEINVDDSESEMDAGGDCEAGSGAFMMRGMDEGYRGPASNGSNPTVSSNESGHRQTDDFVRSAAADIEGEADGDGEYVGDRAALLSVGGGGSSSGVASSSRASSDGAAYRALVEREAGFPWARVGGLLFIWAVVVCSAVSKSLAGDCPHARYWVLSSAPLVVGTAFTLVFGRILRREYQFKLQAGHKFHATDFVWNMRHTVVFPLAAFVAGVAAGMVGIGGGMVIGPLLLSMSREADPTIATSISNVLVLFTSSSSTIQYVVLGRVQWDYALFFSGMTMVASLLASGVIKPWFGTPKRKALFLFLMGGIIGISGVVTLVTAILRMVHDGLGESVGLDALCAR